MNATEYNLLLEAVQTGKLPIAAGRTATALHKALSTIRRGGEIRAFVERYSQRNTEIERSRFSDAIKTAMSNYLENLGLKNLDNARFDAGDYDEYFAQAYDRALFGAGGRGGIAGNGGIIVPPLDSDFQLDTFEQAEQQGVVKENLLAASALYYFHVLGDTLGVFPLVNALILRRARGRLDLPRTAAAQKLTEYKRFLRNSPVAPEDRLLLYKRVFNAGEGETLEGTLANEEFPELYHALMEKAVEYINKEEANSSDRDDKISRSPIEEAIRNLQYNLSYYANDIAEDTLVIKEQFNMAKSIMTDDDVIAAVGVTRRGNMWSLIERLAAEEFEKSSKVSLLRTIGIEGYRILQHVANFDGGFSDDQFRQFLKSAESWIIAQASLGEDVTGARSQEEDEFDEEEGEEEDSELNSFEDDWES